MSGGVVHQQRSAMSHAAPVIISTGIKGNAMKMLRSTVKALGGEVAKEMAAPVTHVITATKACGKEIKARTLKVLQGVASGKWIVSFAWVTESKKAGQWLSAEQFETQSDAGSKAGMPSNPHAMRIARQRRHDQLAGLLHGRSVALVGDFGPSAALEPRREEVAQLVLDLGGSVVELSSAPLESIVLVSDVHQTCQSQELDDLFNQDKEKIYAVVVAWLLDSLMAQELMPMSEYVYFRSPDE
eukprot:gb/GEZN01009652.1/.p1 GENE.gb/GEZN01009652.1/~~gb/GEZN01009652.1/.p1  ORF type:complete len:242 (-),score=48.72 gb/GEZN01009652.1/:351-1076(-)